MAARELWRKQNELVGDRTELFSAVAGVVGGSEALYPGSYVDLTPSLTWPAVTYVDVDRRAERFFRDVDEVDELMQEHGVDPEQRTIRFIHGDYQSDLDLDAGSFDLLISLYAGFVSESCTRYLRKGGFLLVNSSHGDAAMASIDGRYRLHSVVIGRAGRFRVTSQDLDSYLVPKRDDIEVSREQLHRTGRGIAYTKSPFAYLFERIR